MRPEPDIDRAIVRCWISPEHRRKGLATELYSRALQRSRKLRIKYLHVNISEDNKIAATVLSRFDFSRVRRYHEMKILISTVNKDEADKASRECRCLEHGEEAELTRIQNRAFAGQWGYNPNTVETITYYTRLGGFTPEKVMLVCDERNILGYCWLEIVPNDDDGENEGIIHMLGADPEHRGKGIGRKALMAGLAYLMKKGVKTAALSVDSTNRTACRLYQSLGFEIFRENLWYERRVN